VHVLYFDTEVHQHEKYQAGQQIHLTPVGGGGTDFRPCLQLAGREGDLPANISASDRPVGAFPDDAPSYPVIWASTGTRPVPFGQVVRWQRRSTRLRQLKRFRGLSTTLLMSDHSPEKPI
jgi:predicted metal-dependent peptidase